MAGRTLDVEAPVEHDRCEIEDILAVAAQSSSLPCWKRIVSLIIETAENGRPENDELCRLIANERTDDLYEFSLRGGISVIWFLSGRTMVICSVVLDRKSRETEVCKALTLKTEYLKEKDNHGQE